MLRGINELTGYALHATDGDIGSCDDFLFDDRSWVVRYMVARTAKWLPGRKVIISPVLLDQPDWQTRHFPVRLTRQQIEECPPLEEHAPVSRQYEIGYHQYYAMPFYWVGQELWGAYPDPAGVVHPVAKPDPEALETEPEEGHLRSIEEVTGYRIHARDGEFGHVEDFLLDDESWALRYLVIDTRNWLPGRKVLMAPQWLESVDWVHEQVHVDLTVERIKNSPGFDPSQLVDRHHEIALYDYYGQPPYWK
ncbi:MAG: PRC-barrel domain-containing protein [Thiogranum sp.]|nr:PRC-barrel domain-containing protein [Thiogranum sp.]